MRKQLKYGRPWWEVMKEVADENARLKAEVERLRASSFVTAVPVEEYEKLKAEVERLRKAGDEVCESPYLLETDPAVIAWRAANEGKPSAETKSPSFIEDLGNGVEKHDLLFRHPAKEGKPSV